MIHIYIYYSIRHGIEYIMMTLFHQVHVCVLLAHLHLKKVMMNYRLYHLQEGKQNAFELHSTLCQPFFFWGGVGGGVGVFNYKINYNYNLTERLMTLKSKRSEKFLFCCFCQGFQVYLQWGISTFHFMNMQLNQKYMFGFGFGSSFSIWAVWFG